MNNSENSAPTEVTPTEIPEISSESAASEPKLFSSLIQNPELLQRLEQRGFHTATPVQAASLGPALEGKDLLLQAKTGSGKTLAFVVPMLAQIEQNTNLNQTLALIVSPTRELASQINEVVTQLSDQLKPVVIIGGADQSAQQRLLNSDARVVVGTPGRLLDLIKQKIIKLSACRYFVLDEADEMLSMGFIDDVRAILSRLPDKRQGLFVSATITPRVEMLAHSFLTRPERIVVDSYKTDMPPIEHLYVEVGGDLMAKPAALCDIIETLRPRSAIIFCNTKSDTHLVEVLLRRRGFDARRINSDLTQSQREKIIQRIRAQDLQFLVATDIAARGLDIEWIDLVVNFNIHEQPETYIHRTGRTGRAGRSGRAISLIGPRDFGAFHYLTKVVDFKINKVPLPTEEDVAAARVAHVYEIMRSHEVKVSEREMLVARKLLMDRGNISEPPEELVDIIAKLSQFAVEHVVGIEAKSLDEELDTAAKAAPREEGRRGSDSRNADSRRGESDRGRGRSNDRRRDQDQGGEEHRERRDSRDRKSERESNQSKAESSAPPQGERARSESTTDVGGSDASETQHRAADNRRESTKGTEEVRLYVGQGIEQGITEPLLRDLIVEFTGLESNALKRITLRGSYGFVDTQERYAQTILETMGGIEYNGQALPIEIAAVQEQRPRGNDRRGPQGRGGHERGRGDADGNREGGGGRSRGGRGRNDNRGRSGGDRGRGRGGRS